ncbi:MAG: glycosyltransferase [Proteobacteria bacterium]|nr:glycosyltransferase [Pseudomonadota bacterium]
MAFTPYIGYTPTGYTPFRIPNRAAWRDSIQGDLSLLRAAWRGVITYGMKDHLADVPDVAAEAGFERLLLGVYDVSNRDEMDSAVTAARRHPKMIRAVCLGNEGLLFKRYSLSQLEDAFARLREELPGVLLTTSEPIFSWGEKRLFEAVDFCAPIIHPWIHSENLKQDPEAAAIWVIQAAQRLQVLSGKPVLIKETGFPADGDAYPDEHQAEFWDVLWREYGALTRKVHLATFEAFDNPEKINFSAPRRWDNYWGIFDADRRPKAAYETLRRRLQPAYAPTPSRVVVEESDGLSVVIATKDRPEHLPVAIESVLDQSLSLKSLILVDDNSRTDAVEEIWRRYRNYPGMKYIRRTTPGSAGTARNEGFKHVDSKYVCFLDDDDFFLPGKVRAQKQLLDARSDLSGVACAAKVVDGEGRVIGRSGKPRYFEGAPFASMLAFCCFVHSSVMLRTSVVREYGGYLEFFKGEDWELWCRYLAAGCRFEFLDAPLVSYRRHDSNISTEAYVREAVRNVLSIYLELPSERIVAPLPYDPASKDLIKAVLLILHALYADALRYLDGLDGPTARIARHVCYRELALYDAATREIEPLCRTPELLETARRRLEVHRQRFSERRTGLLVGSAALMLEQRLLARDAIAAATFSPRAPKIDAYFAPNPTNINIEDGSIDVADEIFFSRVSLTSC